MMKMFSLRASEQILKEAERLSKIAKVDKSIVLREALEKGLEKIKLETAVKLFSEGKLSLGEAANTAGISVGEMIDKLREAGISSAITSEDLNEMLEKALKIIR
ncbi:MAG: UPF0175 family protein [Nanoarchaeota archaeon]|nr:UPF0175 family protein [Nanoarchaeota archaeon]